MGLLTLSAYLLSFWAVDGIEDSFPPYPLLPDELLPLVRKFEFSLLTKAILLENK